MKLRLRGANTITMVLSGLLSGFIVPAFAQGSATLFEDFNRGNNLVLGSPAAGKNQVWLETETAGSNDFRARIENNMLVLSSLNNANVGSSGMEQVSIDAEGRYATIFNQASDNLVWSFNFRQSRLNSSGFGSTTYGVAYVLGCSQAAFNHPSASGYAVIIGNSNAPDPVKLVRFTNGLTANSNVTTIITSAETAETSYFSVRVTFDPCSKAWSLQVRNDGIAAFADPVTVTTAPITVADQVFTNTNLNFTGAAYNHGTANERAFFDNFSLPTATATAVSYNWTGAVSADFDEPMNWKPNRNCFRTTDILNFSSGGATTISNATSQTISSFIVKNNTVLTLKAKAGATQTISILDGDLHDLSIEAGSALIIDSNDALEFSLRAGATANVAGTFTVQNTAMNLGRAHRLLAADANAIVFQPGSFFFARHLTGEPFGNNGTSNIVIFKGNATYIARDGASPFGLASPNSKVVFEPGSLYRHEQTGTAPKFDGRTYGNFELNVANNLAIIFGTSAINPTRIENFTISSGNMNVTLASGSNPLPLHISGNLTIAPGALLNFNPSSTLNASTITLNGTSTQSISGSIFMGMNASLEINNTAGVALKTPQSIHGKLLLTQGVLTLAPEASLTFEDNATVIGGSNSSYVAGKIFKNGDDAFVFPVGKAGYYAPVGITAPMNITDKFAAEYFPVNPVALFGSQVTDSLAELSNTEYWDLERISGSSEVKVSLSYDASRSLPVDRPEDLRIAHFRGQAGWSNEGMVAVAVQPELSLVSTRSEQTSFSPFTFATVGANNPLPVALVQFAAKAMAGKVLVNWETATEINSDIFEVQRSRNSRDFETIGTVKAAGNSVNLKRYAFEDKNPGAGLIYYRLKQSDLDRTTAFSKVATVQMGQQGMQVSLFPNPAATSINVSVPENLQATLLVLNSVGQVVRQASFSGSEINLEISDLPKGSYLVQITTPSGTLVRKFLKHN